MGEVVELKDPFSYIMAGKDIDGVMYTKGEDYGDACIEIVNYDDKHVLVRCRLGCSASRISKNDLKQLMIMWLALDYPDVLKFDEEGK